MECEIAKGIKHEIVSTILETKPQYFSFGFWDDILMEIETPKKSIVHHSSHGTAWTDISKIVPSPGSSHLYLHIFS
jgi:hypothetical protein